MKTDNEELFNKTYWAAQPLPVRQLQTMSDDKRLAAATALAGSANKNKRMTISIVPGGSGKVYIGTSSMNTSTLAGVYAILYPNSVGKMSEQFELIDHSSCSNLDTSNVYVAGDVASEQITVGLTDPGESNTSYCSTYGTLHAEYAGLSYSSSWPWIVNGGASAIEQIKLQVIPGNSGKIRTGLSNFYSAFASSQPDSTYAGVFHEFWPNSGSYSVGEGWSERMSYNMISNTTFTRSEWQKYLAVSSEYMLVGSFTH